MGAWARAGVVAVACLGAAGVALLFFFPLLQAVGPRLSALKAVPTPVEFVIFDHSTYLAIARNAQSGVSVFTEPFTGTGSSIYPPGYYWAIGELARLPGLDVVAVWNLAGILTVLGLVAMCGAWARFLVRDMRVWLLAPVPLLVGTLAWWVHGEWLGLYRNNSVVLWAPSAIVAMGTAEGFGMLLMGLVLLLLTVATVTAVRRRRLLAAGLAGVLLGLLFHVHAYVAIYTTAMVVGLLLAEDHLRRPRRRRLLTGCGVLLATLVVLRLAGGAVAPTTKIGLLIVVAAALLVERREWRTRLGTAALALVVPALLMAAPYLLRLASEAADDNSFFNQRQAQNEGRDLTLPVTSVLWHELPVLVLAAVAIAGVWRLRRDLDRAVPWLALLIAAVVVTPLLTWNHLWGVDQEPYRFLPYGVFLITVAGVPWLWVAFRRLDRRWIGAEALAAALLLATIPTTAVWARGMDRAGSLPDDPNVRLADQRLAEITGGQLTLLDGCFNPELTRLHGGPNVVRYHPGLAFPANLEAVNAVLAKRVTADIGTARELRAANIRWYATHTACNGTPIAEARRVLGPPVATFPMPEPELYGNPPGTRYQVYRVP
ncbi:MAG: hypothetical protein AB7O78_07560 [Thermoleophilia bacterium]